MLVGCVVTRAAIDLGFASRLIVNEIEREREKERESERERDTHTQIHTRFNFKSQKQEWRQAY